VRWRYQIVHKTESAGVLRCQRELGFIAGGPGEKGVSLVELITALLLSSILVAVGSVNLSKSGDFDLRVTSQKLRSNISKAQLLAVSSASRIRLLVGGGGYAVEQEICETNLPCRWELAFNPSTARPFTIGLPGGISMNGGTVQFNSWGVPTSAAGIPLAEALDFTLVKGNSSIKVSITPTTGFPVVIQ
jgi:hypothetical protein